MLYENFFKQLKFYIISKKFKFFIKNEGLGNVLKIVNY